MTRVGLGSYAYAWAIGVPGYPVEHPMDAQGLVRRAAELDLDLVQIADNLPLDRLADAELAALIAEADRLSVAMEVGTRGIGPDHLRRYLAIAARCRSPVLRVVVDTAGHEPTPGAVVETLRGLLPECRAAGVTLALENHDRFTTMTLLGILEALASEHVGICLDTVNSFGALEGPDVVLERLGPHVVNLHIKDFVVRRAPHNMGFVISGTPAGRGMLDIPRLIAQLHGYGRHFNSILELWPPPEADMAATIAKEDAWVRQSVAALAQIL